MANKFEVVEEMTVGELIDESGLFYCLNQETKEFDLIDLEDFSISQMVEFLANQKVYRKTQGPWWDDKAGELVMVRNHYNEDWALDTFLRLEQGENGEKFRCKTGIYREMAELSRVEASQISKGKSE